MENEYKKTQKKTKGQRLNLVRICDVISKYIFIVLYWHLHLFIPPILNKKKQTKTKMHLLKCIINF